MKKIGRALLVLVILAVLLLAALPFAIGPLAKFVVEEGGSLVLGVPVGMERADFSLLRGETSMRGLSIANPEGFKSADCVNVREQTMDVDPRSLLTDTIVIRRMRVVAPVFTYELGSKGNNIQVLIQQAVQRIPRGAGREPLRDRAGEKPDGTTARKDAASRWQQKKIIIEDFTIEQATARMGFSGTVGGAMIETPINDVHMKDIGKAEGGLPPAVAFARTMGPILESMSQSIGSPINLGDGLPNAETAAGVARKGAEVAGDVARAVGRAAEIVEGLTPMWATDPAVPPPADTNAAPDQQPK